MIHEITSVEDPALSGFLELYIESFDAWGREPVPELVDQIRCGREPYSGLNYRFWAALEGDDVLGLVRGATLPKTGCGYVVHIAVAQSARRSGVASALLKAAEAGFFSQLESPIGTLFECERIEDAENDDDRIEKEQRLAFFQRLGAVNISPGYTQPALAPYLPSMPLNLVLKPVRDSYDPAALVEGFYSEVFGLARGNHFVDRALESVGVSVL